MQDFGLQLSLIKQFVLFTRNVGVLDSLKILIKIFKIVLEKP